MGSIPLPASSSPKHNTSIGSSTPHRNLITEQHISDLRRLIQNANDGSILLAPGEEGYEDSLRRWSRAAEKKAGAVILPKTTSTISLTVRYASQENLDLAVKGGGHSTSGASSTAGGLLLDLGAYMRNVTVNPDTKTLTIQGGAQWSDVDDKAWENGNLATVGGTVADTGVGGLTLGGGYGWLSGRHGLVIDNLISCEMVLADGSIVRSSKESNPDLFWALRGAGQNFGVATEFVIQAWTQQPVWAGLLGFTTDKLAQVLDVLNAVVLATEGQGAVVMAFWRFPPDTSPPGPVAIMVGIVYDGSEADGLSAGFERLLHLDPFMNTLAMVPYNSVSRMLAIPQGKRVSMKGASFTLPLRYEFVQQTLNSYAQFTDEIPEAGFSLLTYEMMDPRIICSVGNTETGFANRGRHMNAMVGPFWESEQFDMKSRRWARDMAEMFKNEALRKRNEGEDVEENDEAAAVAKIYGNYDQYDEKSRDIFGPNFARLQQLKARYDPHNMFNKLFSVAPAVSKVGSN